MAEPVSYFDPKLISQLSGLRLRAAYVADGLVSGGFVSKRYGSSIEFADHKLYTPGDESKYIDWKLHARTDRYFVRRFEDESNRQFHFVLDCSGSMKYKGSRSPWTKSECAATIVSTIATVCLSLGDAVGWTLANSSTTTWNEPSRLQQALGRLQDCLNGIEIKGQFSAAEVLDQLLPRLTRKNVVVILSDFMDSFDAFETSLGRLLFAGHQVLLLQILDSDEVDFPIKVGGRFIDMENQNSMTIDPLLIRDHYLQSLQVQLEGLRQLVDKLSDGRGSCRLSQVITSNDLSSNLIAAFEQAKSIA